MTGRLRDRALAGARAAARLGRDESGATALMIAAGMSMFLSVTAIAVDLGMLATARSEAQRAADAAALAGASALAFVPGDERTAREWAKEFAGKNTVRKVPVTLQDADIDVIGDTVRVRVNRTEASGGQIPTPFARIIGIEGVDVSAVAAAVAAPEVASVNCPLPFTIADRWVNFGSDEWDPSEGDYYEPPYRPDGSENPNYVGYGQIGELFTLSPSQGGSTGGKGGGKGKGGGGTLPISSRVLPSVYNLWLPQGVNGTSEVRKRIMGCDNDDGTYSPQDPMWREPGNVQTLVDEFRTILADPKYSGQYYDIGCDCIRDANDDNEVVTGGLRYRVVPIHDPTTFVKQGSGPHFTVSHFIGVFIDSVDPGPMGTANVYARVMPAMGLSGGGSDAAGPMIRALRLVE